MTTTITSTGLYYLWHLVAIGLIEHKDEDGNSSSLKPNDHWDELLPKDSASWRNAVTVAIIDNGCASWRDPDDATYNPFEHPNLDGRRIIHPVDFTGHVEGSVYGARTAHWGPEGKGQARIEDWLGSLSDYQDVRSNLHDHIAKILTQCDTEDPPQTHHYPEIPDPADRFAAHGTACAGLVAASAITTKRTTKTTSAKDNNPAPFNPNAVAYSGVHPCAKIMPISTVYNSEFWPMICALLWAVIKGADVILIPRGLSDLSPEYEVPKAQRDERSDPHDLDDLRDSRLLTEPFRHAEKKLFETLLKLVAEKIPVVMAAGNDGTALLNYPASLAKPVAGDIGAANLFVAGAVTAFGEKASYSSGHSEGQNTVFYCPSDDGQDVNLECFRYDSLSWRGRNLDMKKIVDLKGKKKDNDYSPYGVMSIDIPGQYGYIAEPGPLNDYSEKFSNPEGLTHPNDSESTCTNLGEYSEQNRPRALYCTFGGTSAASSILAGIIALYVEAANQGGTLDMAALRTTLENAQTNAMNLQTREAGTAKIVSAAKVLAALQPTATE